MKGIRFFFPLIICSFFKTNFVRVNTSFFHRCCALSMAICPIIGIYGYIYQIPWLTAVQDTVLNGSVVVRAGSFWLDSGIFGFICSCFALASIYFIMAQWGGNRPIASFIMLLTLALNLIGIVVAFSRMGGLSFVVGTAFIVWKYGKKRRTFFTILFFSLICIISIYVLYIQNFFPALNQNIDKILLLSSVNSSNVDTLSSTRTILWAKIIEGILEGNVFNFLLGYGYKTESFWILADNGYLYVIVSSGLLGLFLFIRFWRRMFLLLKRMSNENMFFAFSQIFFVSWSFAMLFADVFTYVPSNIMLLMLPLLGLLENKGRGISV